VGKGFPCAEVKIARITDDAARLEELARRLELTAEPPGPGPFGFWQAAWHVTRASLAALVGDRTMAASERAYFERWIGCFPLGMTGRSYRAMPGLVESNLCELDAAVGHLKSAVVFCRSSGFRPELAWTCLDLAETLLLRGASGDEEAASRTLDEGGAVARSLGMSPLITKIEACRNRIAETPAWRDSLSSREAEVLRLVSRGYTNREIGEELYISERTVANHIGNILGNLGASNRAEAAAWAVSHGVDEGSG
jgi:DNA-binding CsgD family transcriptional regulator